MQALLSGLAEREGIFIPTVEAPEDFLEYDEDLETEYHCPKCGYEWSGQPK